MGKYRKRVPIVDAVQFDPDSQPWPDGVEPVYVDRGNNEIVYFPFSEPRSSFGAFAHGVHTPEGWRTVSPGDWIVTEASGYICRVKPDVFEETYEKVTE